MNINQWIIKHKARWIMILFITGISLGLLQGVLLNANTQTIIISCSTYGFLLPIVEFCCGGSGVNE